MSTPALSRRAAGSLLARAQATRASLFDYDLSPSRIASRPVDDRSSSKLLFYAGGRSSAKPKRNVTHHRFFDLPDLLPPNTRLVMNDSRVIPARVPMRKDTGGRAELFLLSPESLMDPSESLLKPLCNGIEWKCLIGGRRIDAGDVLTISKNGSTLRAVVKSRSGTGARVILTGEPHTLSLANALKKFGKTPLPPYIRREADELDVSTYQTIYADKDGSVAAPTAGLHLTSDIMDSLAAKGIETSSVTLHVGAGTFAPMGGPTAGDHDMHEEQFSIRASTLRTIADDWRAKRPIIAVVRIIRRTRDWFQHFC